MSSDQKKLERLITRRVGNIKSDCRTFPFVKRNCASDYKKYQLGGGNILMSIGLVCAFEYLANILYQLEGGSLKRRRAIQLTARYPFFSLSYLQEDRSAVKFTQLVRSFHADNPQYFLGIEQLSDKEMVKFWNLMRNKLVHLLAPRDGKILAVQEQQSGDFEALERHLHLYNQEVAFKSSGNQWSMNVDKLNGDVFKLSYWLSNKVSSYSDADVARALHWVKSELGAT